MGKEKGTTTTVTVLQIVLPVVGTITVAYFGYLGLKLQIETPLHATQTAEVKQTAFAEIFAVPDNNTVPTIPAVLSPEIQPTETPVAILDANQPTPTLTLIPGPSPQFSITQDSFADPVQFIQEYFLFINNRRYKDAWSRLSSDYKQNLANKGGGYDEFVSFWDTVDFTEIAYTEVRSRTNSVVLIYVEILYSYKTGYTTTGHTTYKLIKDVSTSSWLLDPN